MQRRTFVTVAAGGLAALAGCSGETQEAAPATETDETTPGSEPTATDAGSDADTETETESATPTPEGEADVVIGEPTLEVEEGDYSTDAWAEVDLRNEGSAPSGQVKVDARFYDADGNVIDTSTGYCKTLGAGETWRAFVSLLGSDAENADSVETEAEFSQDAPSVPDGVTVDDSSLSGGDTDEVLSSGIAANDTGGELRYLEGISKLYADDVLVGTTYTNITELPDGETWQFENTLLRRHEPEITDHELVLST